MPIDLQQKLLDYIKTIIKVHCMARSALITSLRRAYKIARASVKTGIPADDFSQRTSRRRLL